MPTASRADAKPWTYLPAYRKYRITGGRGVGSRLWPILEGCRPSSAAAGNAAVGTSQSGQRLILWPATDPPLGASELVSGPARARHSTLGSPARSITTKPRMVGRAPGVLTRSSAQRHQLDELEGIFRSRIGRDITTHNSAESAVAEGARLISAGYSRGRIDAIAQAWRRFCLFCLDKGQDWQTASPMLVVTCLGDLFRTSMVRARPLSSMSPP
jgi:hypothetical protein